MEVDPEFRMFDEDKMQEFLSSKLQEMQVQNQASEEILKEKLMNLENETDDLLPYFKIENIWKKLYHRRYCIGFEVVGLKPFYLSHVEIQCSALNYYTVSFDKFSVGSTETECSNTTKELQCPGASQCNQVICGFVRQSRCCENRVWVSGNLNSMELFSSKLSHLATGWVSLQVGPRQVNLQLPPFRLCVEDSLSQNNWLVEQNGSVSNLLSLLRLSSCESVVLCLPQHWSTPLLSTFEINCRLTYVSIGQGFYFITNKISDLIDNIMVIVHPHDFQPREVNDLFLKIYTPLTKDLLTFIHHLLISIPGSLVIPKVVYSGFTVDAIREYKLNKGEDNWKSEYGDKMV